MDRYLDQESGAFYYENLNLSSEEVNRIASTKTFVQKSAMVSPDALVFPKKPNIKNYQLGPNVYIGKGVKIGPGVRIKNSIILGGTEIYVKKFFPPSPMN
jgi:UDP-3-O-[3-hydroxymyristoyl] glucosamine N-acyltransferase